MKAFLHIRFFSRAANNGLIFDIESEVEIEHGWKEDMEDDSKGSERITNTPDSEGETRSTSEENSPTTYGMLKNAAAQLDALKKKLKGTSEETQYGEDTRRSGSGEGQSKK